MAQKININVALSFIDQSNADGRKNYFSLKYVKNNGEISHFKQALKHRPDDRHFETVQEPKKAQNHFMKSSGNVRIWSIDRNGYRELTIDQIVMFNGIKVSHG